MTRTPHAMPDGIQPLQWPAEAPDPRAWAARWAEIDVHLAVVGPGVPAMAAAPTPETTPVVYLPSPGTPGFSEACKRIGRLADESLSRAEAVVWVQAGEPAAPQDVASTDPPLSRTGLAGNWILVPRPRHQAGAAVERLRTLGAAVISQPAIVIRPPDDWTPVDEAIRQLESYDWIVFSSANGVRFLRDRLPTPAGGVDPLRKIKVAAVGPGTAEALAECGLVADLVPAEYRAEPLAEALTVEADDRRFLLVRGNRGREVLAERLASAGGLVDQVIVYRSEDMPADQPRLRPVIELMDEGQIDWVMATSPAVARSLARIFGNGLRKTRLASISPLTSQAIADAGLGPAAEARDYTIEGMIQSMLAANEDS